MSTNTKKVWAYKPPMLHTKHIKKVSSVRVSDSLFKASQKDAAYWCNTSYKLEYTLHPMCALSWKQQATLRSNLNTGIASSSIKGGIGLAYFLILYAGEAPYYCSKTSGGYFRFDPHFIHRPNPLDWHAGVVQGGKINEAAKGTVGVLGDINLFIGLTTHQQKAHTIYDYIQALYMPLQRPRLKEIIARHFTWDKELVYRLHGIMESNPEFRVTYDSSTDYRTGRPAGKIKYIQP